MNWKKYLPRGVRERLDISRWDVTAFMREVAKQIPPGQLILDAGAGDSRYRSLFADRNYIGVDAALGKGLQYSGLDVLTDLEALPFPEKTFDTVLCMNVLEHVRQPYACLKEIHRVLKPTGTIYLLVPLFAREHQTPHDYYRYTFYGINYLLERSGFAVDYIRPVGGYFRVLGGILSRASGYLFHRKRTWAMKLLFSPIEFVAKPIFSVFIPLICLGLDPLDRKRTYTTGFSCKGRRALMK